ALDNYLEMRDRVDDADYLLQRALELALQTRHPGRFVPHYAMVTFMRIPYSLAMTRTDIQRGILERATAGHATLDTLDWDAIDADVRARLTPLEDVPA
ncbi:MAG: kynurenine 3-monooxygenase, partial [Sphingomonas taxi]